MKIKPAEKHAQSAEKHAQSTGVVFKAGQQTSEGNPFDFVLSTASVDRMGDIVEQDWVLGPFRKNPIALSQHDADFPIGTWANLRKDPDGNLTGRLVPAARGTSEYIDTITSLIEQRILRAVSVGFRPGNVELLDKDDPWSGLRLSKCELLECSVVSVPANAEALSLAKGLTPEGRALILDATVEIDERSAAAQLGINKNTSRDSDKAAKTKSNLRRNPMSLSDKIESKQAYLVEQRDALANLTAGIDDEITDVDAEQISEYSARIKKAETDLQTLISAEASLSGATGDRKAGPGARDNGSAHAPLRFRGGQRNREKGHDMFASAACMLKAHIDNVSPYDIIRQNYQQEERELTTFVRALMDPKSVFQRAESNLADMTTSGWAAELVQDGVGEFLELIRDVAIYPSVPGVRAQFDMYGSLTMPRNDGRGRLAGDFVAEGAPLPVKQGLYGSIDLSPKEFGVISPFTKKIARHSMPAIQGLVRTQMIDDTAESLDARFMDDVARDLVRPAGLQDPTETGADNIVVSVGDDVADVITDTTAMIQRLIQSRVADGAVWLINPLRIVSLRNKQDAASGSFPFRAEIAGGTLGGYPFLQSQNVPEEVAFLVGGRALTHANDLSVQIEVSDQATLVMEDDPALVTDVIDSGTPPVSNLKTQSMFQVNGVALKLTAGLDWRITRADGVQVLTSCTW